MQNSFKAVKSWIRELKQYADADIILAIAGNKSDLEELREIQYKGLNSVLFTNVFIIATDADWIHCCLNLTVAVICIIIINYYGVRRKKVDP